MVQFKSINNNVIEKPCGECKSFNDEFCYKWAFPVKENHVPCTKFKLREEIYTEPIKNNSNSNGLITKLLKDLNKFKETIIGKQLDEIYIGLDNLIEKYENKIKISL